MADQKYGIKLNTGTGDFLQSFSEHTNEKKNLTPITFDSIGDAEEYAQDHEIKNFTISRIRATTEPNRNLTESV